VAALLLFPPPAAAAPRTHLVVIEKMRFGALPTDLKTGDMIVWENRDIFRHSATAKDGSFDVDLPAGGKGRTVLQRPGAFVFICKFHPGMRGVLKVAR
jgi:plastocyanin